MNKTLYLGLIIGGALASWAMIGLAGTNPAAIELANFSWIPSLVSAVAFCMSIYKMWASIQGEYARTTPGKAVGFLFIPFYNFYWMWVVYVGFAKDYNKYIQAKNIQALPLPEGLFVAQVALFYCSLVPLLGLFCILASLIITLINISKICDAVNALNYKTPANEYEAELVRN